MYTFLRLRFLSRSIELVCGVIECDATECGPYKRGPRNKDTYVETTVLAGGHVTFQTANYVAVMTDRRRARRPCQCNPM